MKLGAASSILSLSIVAAIPGYAGQAAQVAPMSEQQALAIGTDAYVYGYPLVTMEITRRVLTNVVAPQGNKGAPVNQFAHTRGFVTSSFSAVVAPNNDTLYSQAFLDLSKGPIVLHVPESMGRYFLMPMLSGWTNVFASPGTRTTGTKARDFAIVGPSFRGPAPAGVELLRSPTNMAWILGRTYSTGTPEDRAEVRAFQDQLTLTPLGAWGKDYEAPKGVVNPSIDMRTPPVEQVNRMDAATYFALLASSMKENPPAAADGPMLKKLARIGLVPGRDFEMEKLPPSVARGLARAPAAGLRKIAEHEKEAGKVVNGWTIAAKTGSYGVDYLQRALVAAMGLGANLPEDAIYPLTRVDAEGRPLRGDHRYLLHFPKGQLPPVDAFWSVTLYDEKMRLVDNPAHRHAIRSADDLRLNADGSLDILVQRESPGKTRSQNWLPAPRAGFVLMLRMYWPQEAALAGAWKPPSVALVE